MERIKEHPRDPEQVKKLVNRLHRIQGQLHGIETMVVENRYCGDILNQVAAVEKALQSLGYIILEDHMETCVRHKVKQEDEDVMKEVMDLVQKLK